MSSILPIASSDCTCSSSLVVSQSGSINTKITEVAKSSISPLASAFLLPYSKKKIRQEELSDPHAHLDDFEVEILDKYDPLSYNLASLPIDLKLHLYGPYKKSLEGDTLYYCSNEDSVIASVASILEQWPLISNGAYIGASTLQNLDFIAARQVSIAFLFDISGGVFKYYQIVQRCILKSLTRQEFVENILKELKDSDIILDDKKVTSLSEHKKAFLKPIETLERYFLNELNRKFGFLASDEKFNFVKSLYENNRVFHLALDAADTDKNFIILSKWLNDNGYVLDTFYISNIYEWLDSEKKVAFVKNINSVINKNTYVVYSQRVFMPLSEKTILYQKISMGCSPYSSR